MMNLMQQTDYIINHKQQHLLFGFVMSFDYISIHYSSTEAAKILLLINSAKTQHINKTGTNILFFFFFFFFFFVFPK